MDVQKINITVLSFIIQARSSRKSGNMCGVVFVCFWVELWIGRGKG